MDSSFGILGRSSRKWTLILLAAAAGVTTPAPASAKAEAAVEAAYDRPEYVAIKKRLLHGWGTWDSRNVLSQVLLPDGLSLTVAFKQVNWLGADFLDRALIGQEGENDARVRPGLHSLDGSYTELELEWRGIHAKVETAAKGDDLVILVRPIEKPKLGASLVVEIGLPWNRKGHLSREGNELVARMPGRLVRVYDTGSLREDPYIPVSTPYLVVPLDGPIGISTGKARSVEEIEGFLSQSRAAMEQRAAALGPLRETSLAVESGIAWNTIYEPRYDRVVSTVGRLWNEEYGGYGLFGWDNFFLAYVTSFYSRDLGFANFLEHLRSKTEDGFIPNDDRGNGTKSWDHSQPPVGALMLKEIYKRYPEKWLLEASFDDLLEWNRWWMRARMNDGLLSYGSSPAKNPYGQKDVHTAATAGYESGMDDSPMYEGVPFSASKNVLELQDVGLNSLYVADCKALAEIAELIGRTKEENELKTRAQQISKAMDSLWDEGTGLYLNRRTDTGELSRRISPTMFYPLLAKLVSAERARRMVDDHFFNPSEFYGQYMLPSIARNDPDFPRQRYWKGAVWPPLNFLVYLGLRNYGLARAQQELVSKSQDMFLHEWNRKGFVSENYSALTGAGDDPRLSSDRFHSWGSLMGFISIVEAGKMPAPEQSLVH